MTLAPITTNGPTITVSTTEELREAYDLLSFQDGGGTILLSGGDYGGFGVYTYGYEDGDQPVVIKSADPSDPAQFSGISFREVTNVRVENVYFNSTENGVGDGSHDLLIKDSDNIQIVDSVFIHDQGNAFKGADVAVDNGVMIREASNILFEGNYLEGYLHGLQVTDVTDTDILGNEFTNIQGDGFRGGGLQNVAISDNYMHDFFGVNQEITHSDMIQIWGANSQLLTENLTISGNTLIAADSSSQTIFIRNEEFGKIGDPTSGYYQDITISNNLIYNGHLHGISVADAQGVTVDGNTVLWNQAATQTSGTNDPVNWKPIILLRNTLDSEVTNNIASGMDLADGTIESGNQVVSFGDPSDPFFVGSHFVNPFAGTDVVLEDLYVLSSSPWYGTLGSTIGNTADNFSDGVRAVVTVAPSEVDQYILTYDASLSEDAGGQISGDPSYTYYWTFSDGSTAQGISVSKQYEDGGFTSVDLEIRQNEEIVAEVSRNFYVDSKDIFAFDFEDGAVDISDGTPGILDNGLITDSHDGKGYLIGDGRSLEIDRWSEDLFAKDSFGISLDLTPTGDEKSGVFMSLHETMLGSISEDGHLYFSLKTDEGSFDLVSREPVFADGGTHRIGIAFDGNTGLLELFADGESVSETEAFGTTPAQKYWGLVFGSITWRDSMDAVIDNVEMSEDPAIAGILSSRPPVDEPPVDEPPTEDPPAEEPPVVEPPIEEPPINEPPLEEPPADEPETDDPGDRGDPPVQVAVEENSNFLSRILDIFLRIFGLGSDDSPKASGTAAASVEDDPVLGDLVPLVDELDETLPEPEDDDGDLLDVAA